MATVDGLAIDGAGVVEPAAEGAADATDSAGRGANGSRVLEPTSAAGVGVGVTLGAGVAVGAAVALLEGTAAGVVAVSPLLDPLPLSTNTAAAIRTTTPSTPSKIFVRLSNSMGFEPADRRDMFAPKPFSYRY
jgi:hypothetical protein